MRNIWKLMAVLAVAGELAACNKDKGPEGPTDYSGGCEAVDLGLKVKWASYNVDARNVDGRGSYFAWGVTTGKTDYGNVNEGGHKWGEYDSEASPKYGMTKYTADVEGGDGLKTLQSRDDPATVNWGTKWRTPTIDEIRELLDETKCKWEWNEEKKGYTVKGLATGNSIFLPAAGCRYGTVLAATGAYGYYWSSSVDESYPYIAYGFKFGPDYPVCNKSFRYSYISVRAVTEY